MAKELTSKYPAVMNNQKKDQKKPSQNMKKRPLLNAISGGKIKVPKTLDLSFVSNYENEGPWAPP